MKTYKLSRIQRELNCKLEDITLFLSANGFEYENSPGTMISDEAKQLIDYNLKPKFIKITTGDKVTLPVELRILEAVNREKLLVERIIGFTDFEWQYSISTFSGECTHPIPFTSFDNVICEILLQSTELSLKNIGKVIGLDTGHDSGALEIMQNAMISLTEINNDGNKMVDGDESAYWLTTLGKEYAEQGVKYKTYSRDFEIYWDGIGVNHLDAKRNLSRIKSKRHNSESELPEFDSLELLKSYCEVQSPEIHFPQKGFNLLSAKHKKTEGFVGYVWICFLENFRDSTIRTLVYDETHGEIVQELSLILDQTEELKNELLEKLIFSDDSVSETSEPKPVEQEKLEDYLIRQQGEVDAALANSETDLIANIIDGIESNKKHFNTLEFELELKQLFESTNDDVWIISPWIKKFAFSRRKIFIENYLKKGGHVFVSYSQPEGTSNNDKPMVDDYSSDTLADLERHYNHFYYCELPHFHYKNVWLRQSSGENVYYSGSFNILSFFVNQNQKYVRQEKMAKLSWDEDIETEYKKVFTFFGEKYLTRYLDELIELKNSPPTVLDQSFIKKISAHGNEKLKPFMGEIELASLKKEFEDTKESILLFYREELFSNKIAKYQDNLATLHNNKLPRADKSRMLKEFKDIRTQFDDLLELQMKAYEVQALIEGITVIGKKNFHSKNKRKRR
jgi:hypothetical protein